MWVAGFIGQPEVPFALQGLVRHQHVVRENLFVDLAVDLLLAAAALREQRINSGPKDARGFFVEVVEQPQRLLVRRLPLRSELSVHRGDTVVNLQRVSVRVSPTTRRSARCRLCFVQLAERFVAPVPGGIALVFALYEIPLGVQHVVVQPELIVEAARLARVNLVQRRQQTHVIERVDLVRVLFEVVGDPLDGGLHGAGVSVDYGAVLLDQFVDLLRLRDVRLGHIHKVAERHRRLED